ncbi:MAG: hypothetical protein Q9194_007359 [Teloschistes cf. exilis]
MSFEYFQRRQRVWDVLPSIDARLETEIESISLNSINWTDGSVTPSMEGSLLETDEHTPPDPPSFWKRVVSQRHLKRFRRANHTRLHPTRPFKKLHDGFPSIDSRLDVELQSGSPTGITWTDGSVTPIIVGPVLIGDKQAFHGPKKVGTAGCLHPSLKVERKEEASSSEPTTVPPEQATDAKDAVQNKSPGGMLERFKRWFRGRADADKVAYVSAHMEPQENWHYGQTCSQDGEYLRFHAPNGHYA